MKLYIVIYEHVDTLKRHSFKCHPDTFTEWNRADEAAQATAFVNKRRAWVAEIERPNLIELVPVAKK
jgi:hypothetical protein